MRLFDGLSPLYSHLSTGNDFPKSRVCDPFIIFFSACSTFTSVILRRALRQAALSLYQYIFVLIYPASSSLSISTTAVFGSKAPVNCWEHSRDIMINALGRVPSRALNDAPFNKKCFSSFLSGGSH
ncbi:hypothetical protein BT96DRAFT_461137 [Gymnopus androsaceus JB14]|uniref:Uncharacterized protein n=1 Tax=Gymnopus androsaceus JB14 TaxID=1447944 RepID=A0A6A4ILD3_9AGAR|nr:hypothetical protein BT96DRAFT_461137 [Gymnopus androsaceus JB14]